MMLGFNPFLYTIPVVKVFNPLKKKRQRLYNRLLKGDSTLLNFLIF
jgi:hypothetical protein